MEQLKFTPEAILIAILAQVLESGQKSFPKNTEKLHRWLHHIHESLPAAARVFHFNDGTRYQYPHSRELETAMINLRDSHMIAHKINRRGNENVEIQPEVIDRYIFDFKLEFEKAGLDEEKLQFFAQSFIDMLC